MPERERGNVRRRHSLARVPSSSRSVGVSVTVVSPHAPGVARLPVEGAQSSRMRRVRNDLRRGPQGGLASAGNVCRPCSARTRSRWRGRRQVLVVQAARQRPGAHPGALADPTAGQWRRRRLSLRWRVGHARTEREHDEAGQVGKQPNGDPSQRDHAATTPRSRRGHAAARRRPRDGVGSPRIQYLRSTGIATELLPNRALSWAQIGLASVSLTLTTRPDTRRLSTSVARHRWDACVASC